LFDPVAFTHDRQTLDVVVVLDVELQILPRRTQLPTLEIVHVEQNANLAVLLDQPFNLWQKVVVILGRQLSRRPNGQHFAFMIFD